LLVARREKVNRSALRTRLWKQLAREHATLGIYSWAQRLTKQPIVVAVPSVRQNSVLTCNAALDGRNEHNWRAALEKVYSGRRKPTSCWKLEACSSGDPSRLVAWPAHSCTVEDSLVDSLE
jgi:hypothetical protein